MSTKLEKIANEWPSVKSVFSIPRSEKEYKSLVKILDSIIDEVGNNQSHKLAPAMETIGNLISHYEDQHYPINDSSPVEVLKYFMQEHELRQSDLPEIGSQGVVSEILSSKRELHIEQIKKLSTRFNISPAAFI